MNNIIYDVVNLTNQLRGQNFVQSQFNAIADSSNIFF